MEGSPSDHKLCGFLCAVLSVAPLNPNLCENLAFDTRVHIFSHNSQIGFKSETGVVLSPLDPKSNPNSEQCQATERERFRDSEQCEAISNGDVLAEDSEQCEVNVQAKSSTDVEITSRESGRSGERKKRGVRGIGLVNGSLSVVHQLQALVANKCLKIIARVVKVEIGGDGESRAVVMVDVYLPIAFWSGGQFPKSGSIAGALFRHLSCNWAERTSILASSGEYNKDTSKSDKNIWNLFDCHVLECKLRCSAPDSSKKRLFELDEIFKSIPSVVMKGMSDCSRVKPVDDSCRSGIWELSDDILINILTALSPMDLIRVAATCRHLRSLAATIMPCMKLKLFPHQQAAIEWMLQRERNAEVLPHPLYMDFLTEDGFPFYINIVSGEIATEVAPTITDFHGGLFCDEPGLGKTITALSLVLKTQGTVTDPPEGTQVIWCMHNGDQRCGYYELSGDITTRGYMLLGKRFMGQSARRGQLSFDKFANAEDLIYSSPKRARLLDPDEKIAGLNDSCPDKGMKLLTAPRSEPAVRLVRCSRSLSRIKKNIFPDEGASGFSEGGKVGRNSNTKKRASNGPGHGFPEKQVGMPNGLPYSCRRGKAVSDSCKRGKAVSDHPEYNETWVQCDACGKWRKLADASTADAHVAWFCSMNTDPSYQSCRVPEETWDNCESITYLPGFYTKGTSGGIEQNISFFTSVLRDQYALINSQTKKALNWLAKLHPDRLSEMETIGLVSPFLNTCVLGGDAPGFHRIFQAFGLTRRIEKGMIRWYYPRILDNLAFDVVALRIALCEPLDSVRLYLSQATLIVLPSNLVDHWKTQIEKHVKPGQLRVYVWTDYRKPSAHNLAWDYDVVITTFNRLSAEWDPHKKSVLMQIHWLRVILDEGHTLGSSLNLTNKLQMAVSLTASNRWILTGTPTPNTPNSQLSHLKPMLKFLHEEAYGLNQKSWDAGILRPFEAEMEEGRLRLWELLHRCMISARKIDLQTIPPCIKKVTYLNFNEEHAKSYNELVVTVRRNILMADWNDPSHVESLLNSKQRKFRSTTIRNVRLSCCVAGHIKVTDAGEDIKETMDILVENGLDPTSVEHAFIKHNLLYGGNCNRCKQWCRLPVITPCRHLLCLGCVALDSERCTFPGCSNLYEMQTPETLTRPENPNPKWPVPKDLIELQPSYQQDDWDPDWESTSSSKVTYLVKRLKALQDSNKMIGYFTDESNDSKHMEELFCPYQISNLNVLDCSIPSTDPNKLPPDKVIIFSQFPEHIHVIEQQLMTAGIKFAGMYSPKNSSNKMKSLAMFQHDANCMALLMDGSVALGLDLSFVTHVFLMEPIWDRSLEEQVISRAHRMGATRPIHVETLAMRGTIEEQMLEFLQDADGYRKFLKEEIGKPDREGARAYRSLHDFAETNYLSNLSFVRTNSVM